MIKVLVIADDYTGALDTGAQFCASGARVLVTAPEYMETDIVSGRCCDVLVIDAGSRHLPPALAAERVGNIARTGAKLGYTHFYKKTDSALRGNVGAELAAMLEANGGGALAFAPAYPKSGRVTVGGIHYVDGKPLGESVFARDPHSAVGQSGVMGIIREQTDINAVGVSADVYRNSDTENGLADDAGGVAGSDVGGDAGGDAGGDTGGDANGDAGENAEGNLDELNGDKINGVKQSLIEIYDAENDNDLLLLGRYLKRHGRLKNLAGCAGFAGALPEIYEIGRYSKEGNACGCRAAGKASGEARDKIYDKICDGVYDTVRPDNVLLVTGSVNPITLNQLAGAEKAGFCTITLEPRHKLANIADDHNEMTGARTYMADNLNTITDVNNEAPDAINEAADAINELVKCVKNAFRTHKHIIITAAQSLDDIYKTDEYARVHGICSSDIRSLICSNIGRITVKILDQCNIGTLVVFGGDTLGEILAGAAIPAIAPVCEISPGIVASEIISCNRNMRLITKSGGLGNKNALADIVDYIKSQ